MTSYGLVEWFWAMFEPTSIWPNFTFDQLFKWIGANNDQIYLPMGQTSDSEQLPNFNLFSFAIGNCCTHDIVQW